MDAVSDVLRAVRLSGAVYLNGEFTEPWCVIGQGNAAFYGLSCRYRNAWCPIT